MKTLIAKFPGGYEEWAKEKGEEPVYRVMPPTSMGLELREVPTSSSPAGAKVGAALSRLLGAKGSGEILGEERSDGHDGGADYGCVDLEYGPYDCVHIDP
ncbi:hypothetical protein LARI1_G003316 [Lachnellula arida]|uniref:Uncharacterized protein n=1 Tax=Lachnellula arida TaxID=1316785 RepID=A0A8T9BMS9_9HELO|nr:hypothetical protein LARI1_G003316 [Lachnellula arida]